VRRPRFGETGHRPVTTVFAIRASDFLRHSTFGFRHFVVSSFRRFVVYRSYDRKVAEARADFQMEMFLPPPCWRSKIMGTIKGEQLLARLNWRYATKQFDPSLATNTQRRKKCASTERT
jgi:hypothetical protein